MQLHTRIALLVRLGKYMLNHEAAWEDAKLKAQQHNGWFTQEYITLAVEGITKHYLNERILNAFVLEYNIAEVTNKQVGIVLAGNIPLVGFHDFMCSFITGHTTVLKLSERDNILLPHLIQILTSWDAEVANYIQCNTMLKGCDAYIATGSNNTSRYFEQYFGKYPHIIRRNRTSVAILTGQETYQELDALANDIHYYYGLGCRNVTKLYVPQGYNFEQLLQACNKYAHYAQHNKYKNNYDYNLAIHILNKVYYMTNGSILLTQNDTYFSAISNLNYSYYNTVQDVVNELTLNENIQCIVAKGFTAFGTAQQPLITDYADGVNTMQFLQSL